MDFTNPLNPLNPLSPLYDDDDGGGNSTTASVGSQQHHEAGSSDSGLVALGVFGIFLLVALLAFFAMGGRRV
tara:strand:- start:144 stop:359 length:216 start_codon:yes stop_codon:yes gene_type:complete